MTVEPVAGIVLAAGPSRRFRTTHASTIGEETPKQLLPFAGESLVRRAARLALASRLDRVLVVVGYRGAAIRAEIEDLPLTVVENPRFAEGQSTSVRTALATIEVNTRAALFIPCDQPLLTAATIDRLLARREETDAQIVVPTHGGVRGAPVLFDRGLFEELAGIVGDSGGRQLFEAHAGGIVEVAIDSADELRDIDTDDDYRELLRGLE